MKKKALSLILSAAMALSLTIVPVSAVSVSNFSDVSSDSWYYDSVSYVAEKDYMNGTSATTFEPNGNMTRAMFATVISRVAGAEVDNSAVSEFTDVESGKWYTGAIEWGVENDLLNGYGNGLFGTNNSITRQDICTLTQRFLNWYCEQNNCTLAVDPKVESFTDAASIADYAKEAVEFCRDAGLLTGYEDGSFRPLGTATRAEIAAVIERIEMAIESAEPAGPVVSYTDEDGNKATLAIKAGDVITVDPNGGSVTYDNTTHRDEFTITATEDGITLPNATRSGYHFDGWKVEKDANGAYIFTAQWTRTSSGGGGGGTNPGSDNTAMRYLIELTVNDHSLPIIPRDDNDNFYDVILDDRNQLVGGENETDVELVEIMKDMTSTDMITKALNNMAFNFNDTPVVERIGGNTTRIYDVPAAKVASGDMIEAIKSMGISIDENLEGILTTEKINSTLTDDDKEEITNIIDRLEKLSEDDLSTIYNKVKETVDQDILDNLGIEQDDMQKIADDYCTKLESLLTAEEGVANPVNAGADVMVNPIDVLVAQYGTNEKGYVEAKAKIDELMNRAKIKSDDQDAIRSVLNKSNIYALCDPMSFIVSGADGYDEVDGYYQLESDAQCSQHIHDIIDEANEIRLALTQEESGEEPIIDIDEMTRMIEELADKAQANFGNISGLNAIKDNAEGYAEVALKEAPTLVDLLAVTKNEQNGNELGPIKITKATAEKIVNKLLGQVNANEASLNEDLINAIIDKIAGTTVSFEISVVQN